MDQNNNSAPAANSQPNPITFPCCCFFHPMHSTSPPPPPLAEYLLTVYFTPGFKIHLVSYTDSGRARVLGLEFRVRVRAG
jgi:hypothetical protein